MTPIAPGREVVIAGVGARTALGLSAPATMAAVRAGIAGFGEHPFLIDAAGNKLIVAREPALGIEVKGADRLAALALPAAVEAATILRERKAKLPMLPVVVGLPPPRPGRPADAEKVITERLRTDLREVANSVVVETITAGHAAGAMALEAGWKKIRQGASDFCLVGAVDSYIETETLAWLEKQDQIHGAGKLNNAWGFVPGEAAGWCLLASREAGTKWQMPATIRVLAASATRETKLIKTSAVCTGEALTALFRQLASALPVGSRFEQVLCDMNGEAYRADEYGFATMRTGASFVDPTGFLAPADCWGDVGAASGPLFAVMAETSARKGYARGSLTLLWTGAESGERCGALLQANRAA